MMTDLEITRLCAEAMGLKNTPIMFTYTSTDGVEWRTGYNPLHDDAQAMALIKKFPLEIAAILNTELMAAEYRKIDLNRAICECVANMQKGNK